MTYRQYISPPYVCSHRHNRYAFLPKLARLIADESKRRALLKAPGSYTPPQGSGAAAEVDVVGSSLADVALADDTPPPPPYDEANPFEEKEDEPDLSSLPPDVARVKEMFPEIPIPAIQAALQKVGHSLFLWPCVMMCMVV